MQKPTKTLKQINWPNGNTELCAPYGGGYSIWNGTRKFKNTTELIERMAALGATITVVDNADYDEQMKIWTAENEVRVGVRRWNKIRAENRRRRETEEEDAAREIREGVASGKYPQWYLPGSGL